MDRTNRPFRMHTIAMLFGIAFFSVVANVALARDRTMQPADELMDVAARQLQRGDITDALSNIQTALQEYRATANTIGQCRALEYLIAITQKTGPHAQFVEYLGRAAEVNQVDDRCGQDFQVWRLLGEAHSADNQSGKALDAFRRAASIARGQENTANEAVALGLLGREQARLGETEEATGNLLQSVRLARRANAAYTAGASFWELGRLALSTEDYVAAKSHYWQALLIARDYGENDKEIEALWRLGNIHYYLGDYRKAVDYLQDSAARASEIDDSVAVSRATRSLGNTHYAVGDLGRAVEAYESSLQFARSTAERAHEAYALGNLALIYLAQEKYAKALAYLNDDLSILRELGDQQNEAQALSNLGLVYADKGDIEQAKEFLNSGITLAREIGYTRGVGISKTNLGRLHLKVEDYAEAERELREAAAVFDTLREPAAATDAFNASLFETQLRTYRLLQVAIVAQGKYWQALEAAELGRARAFAELLIKRQSADAPGAQDKAVLKKNQIIELAKAKNVTIVAYSVFPERAEVFCWVIDPLGALHFTRSPIDSVRELVADTRQSIGVATRGLRPVPQTQENQRRSLQRLYSMLIEPIEPYLPKDPSAEVVFVPQDALFLLPFAALVRPDGSYLVDHHAMSVTPSISVLSLAGRMTRDNSNGRRSALIVGNPTASVSQQGPTKDLPPLPGAEREARRVAAILGAEPIIGEQATRENVMREIQSASIVHFATHGLLDTTIGSIPGAIVLAANSGDDGILTASHVMDLKLSAGLVVLSACDTGRGNITGDGVVGLSRSFISAGVPSVVVSLWSIPDGPTAELMAEFYQRLENTPDLAAALREAMLSVRKNNPDPKDWAAFSLIGESRWQYQTRS